MANPFASVSQQQQMSAFTPAPQPQQVQPQQIQPQIAQQLGSICALFQQSVGGTSSAQAFYCRANFMQLEWDLLKVNPRMAQVIQSEPKKTTVTAINQAFTYIEQTGGNILSQIDQQIALLYSRISSDSSGAQASNYLLYYEILLNRQGQVVQQTTGALDILHRMRIDQLNS